MQEHQTLEQHLAEWRGDDSLREAVAATVSAIAESCVAIAEIIALGPLGARFAARGAKIADGDAAANLDLRANEILIAELKKAPVACVASGQAEIPEGFDPAAPVCIALDPLDGSSNIDTNMSVGTIFSVLPMTCDHCSPSRECFVKKGACQLAAGFVIYGPQTALVLTLGAGTHIFTLNPDTGVFCLTYPNIAIPADTNEFAINTTNFRRWDGCVRAYIDDCLQGAEGPHGRNYNTRWIASLVAECYRIMMRGGIFLYPGDRREDYQTGRLRLAYECNPIAMVIEQAGGAATTGHERILDLQPTDIHQRVPLVFGSANEVDLLCHYYREGDSFPERPQLFGKRGLFRTG
ncbi:MAG: class 1 fructose-bisphosphatase [Planctomycetes bacterium]|nr:class 1 fructose-bisphosphatase [Planctomycetota bacterium]